jgi:predicted nucleic acid-binding protein
VIIVDASCVVEVLLQTDAAASVEERWLSDGGLNAPDLVDLEVLQVLRRLTRIRELSEDRALLALGALERLALRRWLHGPLRRRVWALRRNLTAYDGAYVALAERLRCPLLTRDRRLARSTGHDARIELI